MIKIGSLFSGIGAFEQGLKNMGVEHSTLFACDNGEIEIPLDYEFHMAKIRKMKNAHEQKEYSNSLYVDFTRKTNFVKQTYLKNHEVEDDMFFYDVKLLDGTKFKNKLDIVVGGSPCQSFSTVGFQGGLEDARGTLFYEFARIIDETKPKVFIYENVRGLYTHDKGNTWKVIQEVFKSLGYHFKFKLVNAKDFGIPQRRARIIVVGFKNKKFHDKFAFPEDIELNLTMQDLLLENLPFGSFSIDSNGDVVIKYNKKGINHASEKTFLSPKIKKYVMSPGTKTYKTKVEIDLSLGRTVLKTMGNKHRAGVDNYVTTDGKIRMLDNIEAMRMMGFPDSFKLNDSRNQSYKQAGNSIVVPMIQKISIKIKDTGVFDGKL